MSKANIERIEHIIDWYGHTKEWLTNYAGALHKLGRGEITTEILNASDLFLKSSEIDESLNTKLDHLFTAASFKLFAAFEGALRFDTKNRQSKRRVGKDLRGMIKRKKKNLKDIDVSDIVYCWYNRYSIPIANFSILKGLFKYRHWLAHGQYWDNVGYPVKKSAITPEYIYDEMRRCFDEFKRHESDFEW
jgi:hypothetical protein